MIKYYWNLNKMQINLILCFYKNTKIFIKSNMNIKYGKNL